MPCRILLATQHAARAQIGWLGHCAAALAPPRRRSRLGAAPPARRRCRTLQLHIAAAAHQLDAAVCHDSNATSPQSGSVGLASNLCSAGSAPPAAGQRPLHQWHTRTRQLMRLATLATVADVASSLVAQAASGPALAAGDGWVVSFCLLCPPLRRCWPTPLRCLAVASLTCPRPPQLAAGTGQPLHLVPDPDLRLCCRRGGGGGGVLRGRLDRQPGPAAAGALCRVEGQETLGLLGMLCTRTRCMLLLGGCCVCWQPASRRCFPTATRRHGCWVAPPPLPCLRRCCWPAAGPL